MKKYLMMGVAALAFGFAAVSCSSNDDLSVSKQDQYQAAFEKEFGKVDPNQTWGFGDMTTRSEDVNRNQWGSGKESDGIHGQLAIPNNVTSDERTLVYNYFNEKREGATNVYNVNWTDYVISEVWKGTQVYKDGYGTDVKGSDQMNHLQVLKGEGYIDADGHLQGEWEHANDFNNGNHNSTFGTIEGHTWMLNSGTLDFAYHNSTDSKYHNEYIIIPGSVIDPSGALDNYYYIGFDFYATHPTGQASNKNMDVERDWIFTDWIVRISPGEFVGQKRIYVEDLIANSLQKVDKSDWDFNDAVFDVYVGDVNPYWDNGAHNWAVITLRAAGGTLDLRIAGHEVHELFGVPQTTMVNTGMGVEKAPVQFRITGSQITSKDANDIKVVVTTETGEKIELLANKGEATQKFAVPVQNHVKWLKERQHISNGYENFPEYVRNAAITTWWNPAVENPLYQKWY